MAKIALSVKIDVTKIDKSRLFKGEKGTYLDLTTFIDTEQVSQFGDHGFISQSVSKDEKAAGTQTPILGNCKVFWSEVIAQSATPAPQAPAVGQAPPADMDDDIPF
tara:strand:+ start:153 stop:470 length:318 start_codon:yes stop_codon:yes gene_type:complete